MASFPIDSAADGLQEIADRYDAALAALDQTEMTRVREIMDKVDDLIRTIPETAALDASLLAGVRQRHGKLMAAITAEQTKTQATLRHTQKGRKALRGYGNRVDVTGSQIESVS